ncbi:MAG: hypothetical protein IID30_11515 [Planctomycetes bacterium]|nr:hypothetical protein [Planctomycetota bacterium]
MRLAMYMLAGNLHSRSPVEGPLWREGHFAGLVGLGLSLLAAPLASGQCLYEATIIQGPMCTDGSPAPFFPATLDEQGNAAGASSCFIAEHATVWTGPGMAQLLPDSGESRALGILDPDHVVGRVQPDPSRSLWIATYWLNGQETFLPLLPGADTSQAGGINSSLQIVGESNNSVFGPLQAFRWQSGQIEALQVPLGPRSNANDINQAGQVTGWMGTGLFIDARAYIWENGNVTDLGIIPGGISAEGNAINNLSHVVGCGVVPDGVTIGQRHACYWDGQTMIDLGTLPDHKRSVAKDINDLDEIVGSSSFVGSNINTSHAVYWRDGVMYDLNDLVVTDLGGIVLVRALAINNAGQILAVANAIGVLLTPIDSAPGDIDNNCMVNVSDLLLLISEWGKAGSFADINEDGNVNVTDLLALLGSWGE